MSALFRPTLALILAVFATTAHAQTPPNSNQISAYEGLHKAANAHDVKSIQKLISEGADVNSVDEHLRTPAHVAAFASNDEALVALAQAGIDMNALED